MADKIFLISDDDTLTEMSHEPYVSEDLLQTLLEKYPDLIPGDQINETEPRRWLLVSREVPVRGEDGTSRLSLDHLYVDQDAIPTLVEVKRSTDTRIRREVVGQMLDYAANAVAYWPIDQLRGHFDGQCIREGKDPDEAVRSLMHADPTDEEAVDRFWLQVKTNLHAGRVRLLFVADIIPPELRSIIEFLNRQMSIVEVLGVEIRQFTGAGRRTLVPRVYGRTEQAQQAKGSGGKPGRQWDEQSFFAALTERKGTEAAESARSILLWAQEHGMRIWYGKGIRDGSLMPIYTVNGVDHFLFALWTYGAVEMQFQRMVSRSGFDIAAKRKDLLGRLNAVSGVSLPPSAIDARPSFQIAALTSADTRTAFLSVIEWAMDVIRNVESS